MNPLVEWYGYWGLLAVLLIAGAGWLAIRLWWPELLPPPPPPRPRPSLRTVLGYALVIVVTVAVSQTVAHFIPWELFPQTLP